MAFPVRQSSQQNVEYFMIRKWIRGRSDPAWFQWPMSAGPTYPSLLLSFALHFPSSIWIAMCWYLTLPIHYVYTAIDGDSHISVCMCSIRTEARSLWPKRLFFSCIAMRVGAGGRKKESSYEKLLPHSDKQYDVADNHRSERRTVEGDESDAKLLRQTGCAKKQWWLKASTSSARYTSTNSQGQKPGQQDKPLAGSRRTNRVATDRQSGC